MYDTIRERSAGAVVYRRYRRIFYLLLQYLSQSQTKSNKSTYWDFPRGNIEKGEGVIEAARREITEETGIRNFRIIPGFRESVYWIYNRDGKLVRKEGILYLAETSEIEVRISSEHLDYKWSEYPEARDRLTFDNSKKVLKKADDFLTKRSLMPFFKKK